MKPTTTYPKQKLTISKETLRLLNSDEQPGVARAATTTRECPSGLCFIAGVNAPEVRQEGEPR